MSVRIMVDTGCDMLPEEAEKLGVTLIPLHVRFGEEEFLDGFTISRDEFYRRMKSSDTLPKTSQISPYTYETYFKEAIDAGDEVVCLVISSGVSGCYGSACLAAEAFIGKVYVVDTLQFCGSEYLLTARAVQLKKEGMNAAEIAKTIEQERQVPTLFTLYDTLEYLKKGGRINPAVAFAGELLGIKPILSISKGGAALVGKARGLKKGNHTLIQYVKDHGGIRMDRPFVISWAGEFSEPVDNFIKESIDLYGGMAAEDLPRLRVGATIGTYAGEGAYAIAFYPAKP